MDLIYIALAIFAIDVVLFILSKQKINKEPLDLNDSKFDYAKGYKSKWLFSYNEKDAFNKIKAITDPLGLYLFAKVRLYDLVEPKQNIEKRQGHIFKIQAKHVDFVICDAKLVARMVIELDDTSHDAPDRAERDSFVDAVLTDCGYKVLHIRTVEPEKLKSELESVFRLNPIT